jgi:hypothetical protein
MLPSTSCTSYTLRASVAGPLINSVQLGGRKPHVVPWRVAPTCLRNLLGNGLRLESDQFRRISANAVGIAGTPAVLDLQIAADGPTHFLQPLRKRREASLYIRVVRSEPHEHANAPYPLRLLRPRRQRPARPSRRREG